MSNFYQWLNKEKSRYYTITIKKTATNTILSHRWGSCITNRGGKKELHLQTKDEAKEAITKMIKRRKSRGYELITPYIILFS